jgi:hypothetical protein
MKSVEDIASEALLLPKDQRFTLAHRILSSVEPEADAAVQDIWNVEIRERIQRYDTGRSGAVPGGEVAPLNERILG